MHHNPELELLRELSGWEPETGVVSVYIEIDAGDRGEGFRIELKNGLADVDRDAAERVLARVPDREPLPHGRTQVGFFELGGRRRELWDGFQMSVGGTEVVQARTP